MWYEVFSEYGGGNVVCRTSGMKFVICIAYFVDPGEEGGRRLECDLVLYKFIFPSLCQELEFEFGHEDFE